MAWNLDNLVVATNVATSTDFRHARTVRHVVTTKIDGKLHSETWSMRVDVPIPAEIQRQYGFTEEEAKAFDDPAEILDTVASFLVGMADTHLFAVYNTSFKFAMFETNLARLGLPTCMERLQGKMPFILDPLVMNHGKDARKARGPRSLTEIAAAYDLQLDPQLDPATAENHLVYELMERIVAEHPELTEADPRSIMEWQAKTFAEWAQQYNDWLSWLNPQAKPSHTFWPLPPGDWRF